jgi:hypothetical protein
MSENYYRTNSQYYNNLSYRNQYGYRSDVSFSYRPGNTTWKNNITYESTGIGPDELPYEVALRSTASTESHNNWDWNDPSPGSWPYFVMTDTITVTDADFTSLNTAQLWGARKADGSLPDVTFGRLVAGSDLIGAGTNLEMSVNPPMGIDWAYYDSQYPSTSKKFMPGANGKILIDNNGIPLISP